MLAVTGPVPTAEFAR